MKFSDLTYREYLAMEIFPTLLASHGQSEAALEAFLAADAFLKRAGREQDKIAEAKADADRAEARYSMLLNMPGDVTARIALMQIWEILGVKDQTAAVQTLRELSEFRP